jgi:hypothetical protein
MQQMFRYRWIATALALVLSAAFCGAAWAQSTGRKKKVIRLQEITVEGRIQKPQAFYILPRSNLDYKALEKPEHFLGKIKASVKKAPF